MICRSRAVIGPGGVLELVDCAPPLTLRRVRSDAAATCTLCLVGTAAGPLAGDDLELSLHVRPGAHARVIATGASIAQGRGGDVPARLRLRARVDAGARLRAEPGPLIVCAGSRVDVHIDVTLAANASLDWREVVVLGRAGEPPGAATLRWDVTRGGRPLLRQCLDLTDASLMSWPGMLGQARVVASALLSGPDLAARTIVATPAAAAQRLDDHAVLVTVLGSDAATARAGLADLCRAFGQSQASPGSPASPASSASTVPSIRP